MGKVTYSSLKLKTKEEVKEINFGDSKIEVQQYLPIQDKIDLIDITLQKAKEGRLYNPIKVDMFFHLNLIYLYTNITFTDKQREDEYKLYDNLQSNGVISQVITAMNENEYNGLLNMINEKIENELRYNTTAAAVISKIVDDLPKNAEAAQKIVNSFDKEKYQEVINFAKAANGGREITQ